MQPGHPVLCVIVPALNEARVIGQCLAALACQDVGRKTFEVVVVDNGSSDETCAIALSFQSSINLRVLKRPGVRISALRNYGAGNGAGAFLAFLDADCLAPTDWIRNAIKLLGDTDRMITGALYRIPETYGWVARAWYGGTPKYAGPVRYIPGGCIVMARATFALLGGFDDNLETAEDFDLCRRAIRRGIPVNSNPTLGVVHLGTPNTVRGFFVKQLWHGKHVMRGLLKDISALQGAGSVALGMVSVVLLAGSAAGLGMMMLAAPRSPWFMSPVAAFLLMCFLLSLQKCVKRRSFRYLLALMVLNAVYCSARAFCIAGLSGDYQATRSTSRKSIQTA